MSVAAQGRVTRVNGPLVEVADLPELSMHEIVEIGRDRLPGEVVAIRGTGRHRAGLRVHRRAGARRPGPRPR